MHPLSKTQETTNYGTSYRFQQEDAADGTSFAPFGPCKNTRQFPSSMAEHSTINTSTESAPTRPKRGKPYHKTIAIVFASRLFQIEDNQGPNADDVGNNVNKMWHTQVVGQDGFFQSGPEDIQSRVSTPFSRLTMNSVIASPSRLPNTLEAVRCRHRLNSRTSKTG